MCFSLDSLQHSSRRIEANFNKIEYFKLGLHCSLLEFEQTRSTFLYEIEWVTKGIPVIQVSLVGHLQNGEREGFWYESTNVYKLSDRMTCFVSSAFSLITFYESIFSVSPFSSLTVHTLITHPSHRITSTYFLYPRVYFSFSSHNTSLFL